MGDARLPSWRLQSLRKIDREYFNMPIDAVPALPEAVIVNLESLNDSYVTTHEGGLEAVRVRLTN
ncbi:hypothetical protein TOPH_06450 [Tolypocladium ophioglossoides CBS 100239]|uniref:Uncharacterized protein n=1 Tax=Tolypocladium ophioglossoides (strain CBS 100239) TaxID=1163406 RepID=A0A0L0N4J1_TOLOC|nr:hypothetical protein TOPH_06450 [Tolypocladium ophioglossoides CBS 100239]